MRNNWERNQIITAAATRIMAQADPAILTASKRHQVEAIWKLRHKLADEAGCDFDTTSRHIGIGKLKAVLERKD